MSMAGNRRLSTRRRSRWISQLPVPLNSSKMTSSMRDPVSMSAVAMIVREPPSSMLRAAPKKRFGRCKALASIPPERILPEGGTTALCARARRVRESSRITTSRLCSTRRLAFSMTMSATCTWRGGGSSKGEEMTSPFAGRRDDQAALALADGRDQIDDARDEVVARRLHHQPLVRVERRQVVEEDLVARVAGGLEVDGLDLDEREVALALLGRADLARDGVAGAQVELADLRRADVDVVGAGQVVVLGRAQEAEAVGQGFEYALGEDEAALLGLRGEDFEDELLLAHAGRAGHVEVFGDLSQLGDGHLLERGEVEGAPLAAEAHRLLGLPVHLGQVDVGHRLDGGGGLVAGVPVGRAVRGADPAACACACCAFS